MKRILAVWLLTFVIITTGVCADNEVKDGPVDKDSKANPVTEQKVGDAEGKDSVQKTDKDDIKMDVMEIANKAYMESVENLKWAMGLIISIFGIMVAVILGLVGFVVVRHSREYKEALAGAREEAAKEARLASDKARDWEEKARDRLVNIDREVKNKLEEIEEKGKESIENLLQQAKEQKESLDEEAEKQRKILDLWGKASKAYDDEDYELSANLWKDILEVKPDEYKALYNWGNALLGWAKTKEGEEADKLYVQACEKYERALAIKPDDHNSLNNWAITLANWAETKEGEDADKLYVQVCEKYERAVAIKPDYYDALNNWGNTLLGRAKIKEGEERNGLLDEAQEIQLKAEAIKKGSGSYNLACVFALRDDEPNCRKWLEAGQEAGTLPKRGHAMKDEDLKDMREKDWFGKIGWK